MRISEVSKTNINNRRVLPFRGDTLPSIKSQINPPNNLKPAKSDNATKFLIGSGTGAIALVALVLAGKGGLLGKAVKGWFSHGVKAVENAGADAAQRASSAASGASSKSKTQPRQVEKTPAYVRGERKTPVLPDVVDPILIKITPEMFSKCKTDGQVAALFSNIQNEIIKLPASKQVANFTPYLEFVKLNVSPEVARGNIMFSMGRYSGNNNVLIAGKVIEFAKQNPKFNDAVVDNLLSYECPTGFNGDLALHNFGRPGHLVAQIDKHMDNLIKMRKMLLDSGLKCDDFSRLKARRDWLNTGYHTPNTYLIGFQYDKRMPEFKQSAFKYDMMNGIDRKTADEIIEMVSAEPKTTEKTLGMKMDEILEEINKAVTKEDSTPIELPKPLNQPQTPLDIKPELKSELEAQAELKPEPVIKPKKKPGKGKTPKPTE